MQQLDLFGIVEAKKPENNIPAQDKPLPEPTRTTEKPRVEKPRHDNGSPVHMVQEKRKPEPASTAPVTMVEESITVKTPVRESKRGRKSYKEMEAEMVLIEVPEDEVLFQKQYYSISEVAQWFHVNASLIRYWENEFDVLKPRKTRKGDRLFRPEDVKNIHLIYYLLRQRKFSIEGAKQFMKENKKKADAQMHLVQSLTKFRSFLLEWKAILGA